MERDVGMGMGIDGEVFICCIVLCCIMVGKGTGGGIEEPECVFEEDTQVG